MYTARKWVYNKNRQSKEDCAMALWSEKVFLQLDMPTEDDSLGDQQRITQALNVLGYETVRFPRSVLQKLYPVCREWGYAITVTLVNRETEWVVTQVEPGDRRQQHYGLAVDYGSTTIVMELLDLTDGSTLARETLVNGQAEYGTDILTRITYTMEAPANADTLRRATADTFNALLNKLSQRTGIDAAVCPVMIVSANTTMVHFLLGLNAWTVFAAPYAPVTTDPGWFSGEELGFAFSGQVLFVPAASNYVGGDIISGLLKLELHKSDQPALFFDIGTNGELVIGCKDWVLAGAGAAGPALEGYISPHGMRAAPGAVDTVAIDGPTLGYTTIAGEKPRGICGSGIIDLLAQMRLNGWINIAGELNPAASPRIAWIPQRGEYAAVYATGEETDDRQPRYFSQTDIRQYLETKAAAYTMIECLLETAGCSPEDLSHAWLSGAFTAHSDLNAAITIGMFPDLPREKYTCIANTSLEGAKILLQDRSRLAEARKLAGDMYCVQFASIPDFIVRMRAAKFIPHPDLERFPSIREKLPENRS